jgi:hypothetical protein
MDQGFVAAEAAGIEFTNRAYPARPLYATVSPSEAAGPFDLQRDTLLTN